MSKGILTVVFFLQLLLGAGWSIVACAQSRDFDLVVEPAIDESKTIHNTLYHIEQEAIIYRFRGRSVTSEWNWRTTSKDGTFTGSFTLEGTFVDGILKATSKGVSKSFLKNLPPQYDPGKPFWIGYRQGTIEGAVTPEGRFRIHSSDIVYRQTGLVSQSILDANGQVTGYKLAYSELPTKGLAPTVKDYSLELPFEVEAASWYRSKYFIASGERDDKLGWVLDRLSGQMEALSQNLVKGMLPLARQQWQSIRASLKELEVQMADKRNVSLSLAASPADASMEQIRRLETLSKAHVKLHKLALTQNAQLLRSIEALKLNFMSNVMKVATLSFISWTNVIPTDMYTGLEGYSLNTSLFALPKTLVSWQQQAKENAAILKNQTVTIRMMEVYADYWSDVADRCVSENRKIHDRLDGMRKDELASFASEITAFFSSLQL
ncbi:hypothetical protein [uncultured Cohaesibacter sp.]|uniref:hypothetical protein n=1 Tax=uncultured Cohaesibacter sp. TaxID=1002546 RepID=UPI0029C7781E|nr:hypothetical protein [uncultured Cohaesibacter sp.]